MCDLGSPKRHTTTLKKKVYCIPCQSCSEVYNYQPNTLRLLGARLGCAWEMWSVGGIYMTDVKIVLFRCKRVTYIAVAFWSHGSVNGMNCEGGSLSSAYNLCVTVNVFIAIKLYCIL
jgi:hypothetical protein